MTDLTIPTNPKWQIKPIKWRKAAGGGKAPYQGLFIPGNPDKYEGDVANIIFRSGIELRLFKYLDESSVVLKWSSEETVIPYVSPKDNRVHRYFVDAKVLVNTKERGEQTFLVEVKPSYQCVPPNAPKKPNKKNQARYLREAETFLVNKSKWDAAESVCEKRGWKFLKITEEALRF